MCNKSCWVKKSVITFWEFVSCSQLSERIALMMEAVSTSEASDDFYVTTRRSIPEDYLHFKSSFYN
jgi:hypothetical protein